MGKRAAGVHDSALIRHGRLPRRRAWPALLRGIGATLAVALVASASVAAIAIGQLSGEVRTNAVDISMGDPQRTIAPAPHIGAMDGGFNLLMVGVDNDPSQGEAYGDREGATLNDVNILVHVPADHRSAVVVSLPRDLVIPHPECTDPNTGETFDSMSAQPLNEAFSRGGLGCVVATVEDLTSLPIDYAGYITFQGVIDMTDAVGGVPVCLSEPIDDPDAALSLPAGINVVSGANALGFLRSRHGVGDGSDLARISSQQSYMSSLVRTAKSSNTLGNITRLYTLARAAAKSTHLSSNLANLDSIVAMAYAMKDIDLDRLVFVQYPGSTGVIPNKVVPVEYLADELFAKISADEPFTFDGDSFGRGATASPDQPGSPAQPTTPATPGSTDAPAVTDPTVIDGIQGQLASTSTCVGWTG